MERQFSLLREPYLSPACPHQSEQMNCPWESCRLFWRGFAVHGQSTGSVDFLEATSQVRHSRLEVQDGAGGEYAQVAVPQDLEACLVEICSVVIPICIVNS